MIRAINTLLVAGIVALAPAGWVHSGLSTMRAAQPSESAAYDQVASCFAEREHLVVLALVDESTSLRETDPNARRADALVNVLRMLARRGGTTEGDAAGKIEVQLAGFSTVYEPGSWATLDETPGAGLEDAARAFGRRELHDDTDFAAALLGAQATFLRKDAELTRAGGQPPCRLLLLFTDGKYELGTNGQRDYAPDVDPDDRRAIRDRGRHVLCDGGQLVDQLRESGTVIVAVGLAAGTPNSPPPNHGFLQAIAERVAPGESCGTSTATPGKFIPANGLDQLISAFDKAIGLALGGTIVGGESTVPVCGDAGAGDTTCERSFRLDEGLREFHLLLNLGASGIEVELRSPAGSALRAGQQGDHELAGASLTSARLGELDLVIDGRLPAGSTQWVGTWTVRFVDVTGHNGDAVAQSQLTVFGGLVPVTRPERPAFQVGERTDFEIAIVDTAGSPRTPKDFVRSAAVSAVLVDPQGHENTVSVGPARADGTYAARYRMPDDAEATYVILRIRLDVVTSSGLPLQPRTTSYRVPVAQPSAYPSIRPLELVLTPIIDEVDDGEGTVAVTLTGGLGGSGCVWFDQPTFATKPPNTGQFTARFEPRGGSADECVRLKANEKVPVKIIVQPERARTGFVDGQMVVNLKADGEPTRRVRIPVRFEMEHPIPRGPTLAIFIAILVGGILLPLLLLRFVSWLTARFVKPNELRWARHEVVVTDHGITPLASPRPLRELVTAQSLGAMVGAPSERASEFGCGELHFTSKVSLLPWALPYAVVRAGSRPVLSSSGEGSRDLRAARVGFELNRTWVFVVAEDQSDGENTRLRGSLYLFVSDFELTEKAAQVTAAVERDLPARIKSVHDRIRAALDTTEAATEPADPDPDDVYYPPSSRR